MGKKKVQSVKVIVGALLREFREQKGVTQEELANRLGYKDKSSISKLERGETGASLEMIESIAIALDTPPQEFLLIILRKRYPDFMKSDHGQVVEMLADHME